MSDTCKLVLFPLDSLLKRCSSIQLHSINLPFVTCIVHICCVNAGSSLVCSQYPGLTPMSQIYWICIVMQNVCMCDVHVSKSKCVWRNVLVFWLTTFCLTTEDGWLDYMLNIPLLFDWECLGERNYAQSYAHSLKPMLTLEVMCFHVVKFMRNKECLLSRQSIMFSIILLVFMET